MRISKLPEGVYKVVDVKDSAYFKWIRVFRQNWKQFVDIGEHLSGVRDMISRVLQVAGLCPFCFLLVINNILWDIPVNAILIAEDCI